MIIGRATRFRIARDLALIASVAILGGPAAAAPAAAPTAKPAPSAVVPTQVATPPASLISGEPARGAATDPVFKLLQLERLGCRFNEEKRVALLARPLTSTGTIYFER